MKKHKTKKITYGNRVLFAFALAIFLALAGGTFVESEASIGVVICVTLVVILFIYITYQTACAVFNTKSR